MVVPQHIKDILLSAVGSPEGRDELVAFLENIPTLDADYEIVDLNEETDETIRAINILADRMEKENKDEFNSALTILSDKVDKLTEALKAVGEKLDAEDVTNLDQDYYSTIQSEL
jgi:hypothetical protein